MAYIRVTPLNRPIEPAFDWSREYSQAERDAWERYRAEQETRRAEFLKEWSPPFPSPNDPEDARFFEASAIECGAFECWQLHRQGHVAAATTPHWVNHVEDLWLTNFEKTGVFNRQDTAASITLPFLMTDGEFSVTYESYKQYDDEGKIGTQIRRNKQLRVRSEHGVHYGRLQSEHGEMTVELVVLPKGTPLAVAQRVANAYGRIVYSDLTFPEDYPIVMPLSDSCSCCGRPLTDQVSKTLGIGPDCASRLGVPHSAEFTNRIIAARRLYAPADKEAVS